MQWFDLQRDKWAVATLVLAVMMIATGLTGSYKLFGYCVVLFIGVFAAMGFARPGDNGTWVPPIIATVVLLISIAGMYAYESAPVNSTADTFLGFQKGTAFLIYGVWIPAFFTLALTFYIYFDRLGKPTSDQKESR